MQIHESAENYLETILVLRNRKGSVRSIDIATELGFSKPSVSIAMKNLRENGYIAVDDSGNITLLENCLLYTSPMSNSLREITSLLTQKTSAKEAMLSSVKSFIL